uniref:BPI/LBP family protein n=1 Tax=Setaria digitata TaxID=48799 RepID=A0A915PBH2_9BILA
MRIYFLLFAQTFVGGINSEVTLRIKLNEESFTFMASVAEDIFRTNMETFKLPSQIVSFDSGSADIKNLKVGLFESPDINISSVAPNGLMFSSSDGFIAISGTWKADYRIFWAIHLDECQLKIGNLNLKLYGGLAAWIGNHFISGMEKKIEESVQQKEDPKVTNNFIQFDYIAYATFGWSKCYLEPKEISDSQTMSNHMVTLWLGEPMINCFLETWYKATNNHVYISNSAQFSYLFNVNCTGAVECTRKFNGQETNFEDQSVDLDIYLRKAPLLLAKNGIYTKTTMKIFVYQSPKNISSLQLAELTLHTKSSLKIEISPRRITIRTEKIAVTTSEDNSTTRNVNEMILENLMNVAEDALKTMNLWEQTIAIPKIEPLPHLILSSNAEFTGNDNFIRVDLNFNLSDH